MMYVLITAGTYCTCIYIERRKKRFPYLPEEKTNTYSAIPDATKSPTVDAVVVVVLCGLLISISDAG